MQRALDQGGKSALLDSVSNNFAMHLGIQRAPFQIHFAAKTAQRAVRPLVGWSNHYPVSSRDENNSHYFLEEQISNLYHSR